MENFQDFKEKYYPNYSNSEIIALSNDLHLLLTNEYDENEHSGAKWELENKYNNDRTNPQIKLDFLAIELEILQDTINNFIKEGKKQNGKN